MEMTKEMKEQIKRSSEIVKKYAPKVLKLENIVNAFNMVLPNPDKKEDK